MPRNGTGGYNLPASNPVTTGTTISSTWGNTTMADLGNEIANSLPVDGQRSMAAVLKIVDGAIALPGVAFGSQTDLGFYRAGASDMRVSMNGSDKVQITSTGINTTNIGATTPGTGAFTTLAASGAATLTSATLSSTLAVAGATTALSVAASGNITVGGTLGVTGATTGTAATFTTSVTSPSFVGTATAASAVPWSGITSKPTTVSGYGITDAVTLNGSNTFSSSATLVTSKNSTNTGSTTANSSLVIGNVSGSGDTNDALMTFICNGSYAINMHLRPDGYFGIGGWSSPAYRWYSDPSGNMVASGDVNAYSDPRLKKKVKPIINALQKVEMLDGVNFTWIKHEALGKSGKKDVGVLADQVKAVMPEAVHTSGIEIDGEFYDMVAYDKLIPLLIEAVKELSAQVKELRG